MKMEQNSMFAVGFLGLGRMGDPMARRLLLAGHSLTVWNRTRSKSEALKLAGAKLALTPCAAAQGADVVVCMLSDGLAVGEVLFGSGVVDVLSPGCLVIDMSSVAPRLARKYGVMLAEHFVYYLDAPVSGGTKGAREGTLAIMVGGDETAFQAARPILSALGTPRYVGPVGAGQVSKLANQIIVGANIGAVAEALLLARSVGVSADAVFTALTGGFADSRVLVEHGTRMLRRDFDAGGSAALHLKDINNALEIAGAGGLSIPITKVVRDLLNTLCRSGHAEYDHSAILLALEGMTAKDSDG